MRVSFVLLAAATLVLAACGKPVTGAAVAPEQSAVLANRADARAGLQFQRMRLNTDQLPVGLDQAGLGVVADNYRALALRIAQRSRPLPALRDFAAGMDGALAFQRATLAAGPAGGATLTAVVGEFQATFKRAAADADSRLGRVAPPPPDDDLVWNPRVGRESGKKS
ncbi:MAG: hypothetical protein FJZ01_08225 [Candidatus Sericytochromatia bacterium]|nr:hypothetical protein [Candidatus Tanganyikabacteria bacterium]